MKTQQELHVKVTVALRMSASIAARKLGKAHAEGGIQRLDGDTLHNTIIAASTKDIRAYNQDILAFPKVISEDEKQVAMEFYRKVFSVEYDQAYTRFSTKR